MGGYRLASPPLLCGDILVDQDAPAVRITGVIRYGS
jgi:hypothetical protein